MPIYDFQCSKCGFKAEVMRKISAANVEHCPQCGTETFTKQVSAPSFQLNGNGWYVTDFKNDKPAPAIKPNTKPETKSAAKSPIAASK